MMFDKFCSFAEQTGIPEILKIAHEAKLFVFDKPPHHFLPQEVTAEQAREVTDLFFLPFPVVAVEDPASCVILMDTVDNQQGWEQPRKFIEIRKIAGNPEHYRDLGDIPRELIDLMRSDPGLQDINVFLFGELDKVIASEDPRQNFYHGSLSTVYVMSGKDIKRDEGDKQVLESTLRSAKTAVEEILYTNTPDRFIVEKSVVRPRKLLKGRALRSHDRPQYTLLHPGKIRETMKLPPLEKLGIKMIPHPIRRHWRTFKSPKFKNVQGSRIMVAASWTGPSENVVGKHKYKVMLDK